MAISAAESGETAKSLKYGENISNMKISANNGMYAKSIESYQPALWRK
jgi:hypothetical protein